MDILQKCYTYNEPQWYKENNLYPFFRELESCQDTEVYHKGEKILMLGSNSYLGLNNNEEIREASRKALEKYGPGNSGSRFLNGTLDIHHQLEKQLATYFGFEDALLFGTGYQTLVGVISCLTGPRDYNILDQMDHASIIDACRMALGKYYKYKHNNMDELRRLLNRLPEESGKLISVDGVFSMEGDIADLPNIVKIAKEFEARILIDDAHGAGVIGPGGKGTAAHFGVSKEIDLMAITFSKTFVALGGAILGDYKVIDYLKHNSRSLIFSASIPAPTIAAVSKSLEIMEREPERLERLWEITKYMMKEFTAMGFNTGTSETPIIPIYIGSRDDCFKFWSALTQEGIFVNPVIPPAVPDGHSLIRTSYMATHTDEQLDFTLEVFKKIGKKLGVI